MQAAVITETINRLGKIRKKSEKTIPDLKLATAQNKNLS
jgi:hypothetical protein